MTLSRKATDKSESGETGKSRDITLGFSIRSRTSSPTATFNLAANCSFRTTPCPVSFPKGFPPPPIVKKRASTPSTSILLARRLSLPSAIIPRTRSTGADEVFSSSASSFANPAVKNLFCGTRASCVLPRRASTIILRLYRTESPTTSAPVKIAVLTTTVSRTPRLVLQ